ncbi:MAG: hypothetical protein JXN61_01150, partial [Sedimentisphaerales bacterium]|nr:hypothetical protein [Sedimentisphaerales bacterium]
KNRATGKVSLDYELFIGGWHTIMQNKPNFKIGKMALTPCCVKHYVDFPPRRPRKNKPNQTQPVAAKPLPKPDQTQFQTTKPNLLRRSPPVAGRSRIKPNLLQSSVFFTSRPDDFEYNCSVGTVSGVCLGCWPWTAH